MYECKCKTNYFVRSGRIALTNEKPIGWSAADGNYWSLYASNIDAARNITFNGSGVVFSNYNDRNRAFSLRCLAS